MAPSRSKPAVLASDHPRRHHHAELPAARCSPAPSRSPSSAPASAQFTNTLHLRRQPERRRVSTASRVHDQSRPRLAHDVRRTELRLHRRRRRSRAATTTRRAARASTRRRRGDSARRAATRPIAHAGRRSSSPRVPLDPNAIYRSQGGANDIFTQLAGSCRPGRSRRRSCRPTSRRPPRDLAAQVVRLQRRRRAVHRRLQPAGHRQDAVRPAERARRRSSCTLARPSCFNTTLNAALDGVRRPGDPVQHVRSC